MPARAQHDLGMKFAVVAHRRSATNEALVAAARAWGLDSELIDPHRALDGIECGTGELERLAAGGVDVRNPPAALVLAHDKLLTARTLRLAGLPHPHTTLLSPALPAAVPELPLVLKPRFGSWGREVELCSTRDELEAALVRLQGKGWFREHGALAQELVEPRGSGLEAPAAKPPVPGRKTAAAVDGRSWDLRVVVAGDRVVGAACRIAPAESGGRMPLSGRRWSRSNRRRSPGRLRSQPRARRVQISSGSTSSRRATGSSFSS